MAQQLERDRYYEWYSIQSSENHAHISGKDHPMYGKKGKKHPLYGKRNLNLTKRNLENNPMKNIESKNKMIQSLKIYYKNKEKNEK